jgi:hypothetical protein
MMKQTVLKLLIMFLVFICMVVSVYKCSIKEEKKLDKLLDNGIVFSGTVIYTKASKNHSYGIVRIKLDSSNVKEYAKFSDEYLFPYRIKDSIAEVYCTVPRRELLIYKKSKVYINSNMRDLEFITGKKKFKGTLQVSTEQLNMRYVKKHTIFKD